MKRFIFIFAFLFTLKNAAAQTARIDLLKEKMYAVQTGDEKLTYLLQLFEQSESMHKDSLYKIAVEARRLAAQRNKNDDVSTAAAIGMIDAWLRLGKTDSALALIKEELPKNPVTGPRNPYFHLKLRLQKTDCFGDASQYEDALSELYSLIADAETYKDSMIVMKGMNAIGVINYNLDHVPEAFNWYFKGLSFKGTARRFEPLAAALYINLAETYRWVEKLDSAKFYIDKAIPLCEYHQHLFYLANALRVKASIYKQEKNFRMAEELMLQCIAIRERTEGKLILSNEQLALANIYMHAGEVDKSIGLLTESLALDEKSGRKEEATALKISYYQTLARCYKLKGDEKNYSATLEKLIGAKDGYYEANSARAIAELQTRYEVQKKENTIMQQQFDIINKNYLFYGSILLSLLATIIAILLFRNYRRRQQLKMDQAVKKEKLLSGIAVKEAGERERKRIAADLHDNLGAHAAAIVSILDQVETQEENFSATLGSLQEVRNNSQAMVSQLDDTIWALKKDALSLTAISDRIKTFIRRILPGYNHVLTDVIEDIDNDKLLPPSQAFHLFRIVQEAINNALKHSNGKNITVRIVGKEQWMISIEDDGKGIDPSVTASSSNGILNMKTRAKEFGWNIEWQWTGQGTTVSIKQGITN